MIPTSRFQSSIWGGGTEQKAIYRQGASAVSVPVAAVISCTYKTVGWTMSLGASSLLHYPCLSYLPVTCPHTPLVHQRPYRFAGDRLGGFGWGVSSVSYSCSISRSCSSESSIPLSTCSDSVCSGGSSPMSWHYVNCWAGSVSRCSWPLKRHV